MCISSLEAWDNAKDLRTNFDSNTELPAGNYEQLYKTAEVCRACIEICDAFATLGDEKKALRGKIQAELKSVRKITADETRALPGPIMKRCYDTLWKSK